MSKVFLINVGANSSDSSRARSPIFKDDRFIYVPFCFKRRGADGHSEYPKATRSFIRNMQGRSTHRDPDWENLTYGDNCANRRAAALRRVEVGDILLFWGLLWRNDGKTWESFTGERGWYLIGALRVTQILEAGDTPKHAKPANAKRAAKNVHFVDGIIGDSQRIFIGSKRHSKFFPRAVDLQTTQGSGLLFRTIRAASGKHLRLHGKIPWNSSTRSCRVIWDLELREDRARARIARNAILRKTRYDLLRDI
jgi:Nucleotide modification associated domain 3